MSDVSLCEFIRTSCVSLRIADCSLAENMFSAIFDRTPVHSLHARYTCLKIGGLGLITRWHITVANGVASYADSQGSMLVMTSLSMSIRDTSELFKGFTLILLWKLVLALLTPSQAEIVSFATGNSNSEVRTHILIQTRQ